MEKNSTKQRHQRDAVTCLLRFTAKLPGNRKPGLSGIYCRLQNIPEWPVFLRFPFFLIVDRKELAVP
jgi:hypothetical protein